MTQQSPPPPPGPEPSNRDKMKDAVHQLLQQKADEKAHTQADVVQEKERNKGKRRMRWVQLLALLGVLVVSVVISIPQWRQPFVPPDGAEAEQHARRAIVFAANLLDIYEKRSGRLPGAFSQVGVTLPGVSYLRTGDSYILSARANERDLTFTKGDDPARFLAGQ